MTEHAAAGSADAASEATRRGVPPGSLRYFAVLFGSAAARPQLEALYAFEAELRRIVDGASHEAAHARLQWWRGEVDRLVAGRPSHPISSALAAVADAASADLTLLHECLSGADLDLARQAYADRRQLEAYLFRSAGALQTLAAAALAGPRALSASEREFARRLGSAVRQAEMLRDLPVDAERGRIYAPRDELAGAGLDPAAPAIEDERARAVLTGWRDRVRAELEVLPAMLEDAALRSAQRHGLVLAALHARMLGQLNPITPHDARPGAGPGPLTRLWTAWRTAVRHA